MKIVASREGLLTAFQHAGGVVPVRSPKPVLRHVRLECSKDGDCIATATDLDVGIRYKVSGVDVKDPGVVLLPQSEFAEILRELSDETITLTLQDSSIEIAGLTSRFELPVEDPAQFPEVPNNTTEAPYKVKAGLLGMLIKRTMFAAAQENSRYALHSVMLEFDDSEKVRMVATDGRRLALMEGRAGGTFAKREGDILLSPKSLTILQKIPIDPEEEIEIHLRANDVLFKTSRFTIYSRLVEGRYPRFQDVFPPESKIKAVLLVSRFMTALRQAKIVTSTESRGVEFQFSEGQLMLTSHGKDAGRSQIRIPVGYDGANMELTFDPQLFIDALRVLDPDAEVVMYLSDTRRATVFKSVDNYQYLVMPLSKGN